MGKVDPYVYELYEVEFLPEVLFGAPYRKSLTTVFPRFLKAMGKYHEDDVRGFLRDAFGYEETLEEGCKKLVKLFADKGVDMHFDGTVSKELIRTIDISTSLSPKDLTTMIQDCIRSEE